ncbi:DNA-directed RNA polymerase III subunit C31 [Saccharomycopsis crataegensis]|uniref:DNA-directed RNA polymerase III subunit n=1 Tax=Saccharomycopsis crataegensis TaxID=43959 RepID=A0AAV5QKD5_9ASCO|nr:DNA-directed RNA polymerase III subunit C31 [Saccharomycopsis crataegensis]
MSGRRFGGGGGGYGGGAFGLGIDYNELKEVKLDIDSQRTMILPVNGPLNEGEKAVATQFIHFQELVKDGPFFTGSSLGNTKNQVEDVGINDGVKRYSDRYAKKRKVRSASDYPFRPEFFPTELHDVIKVRKGRNGLKLNSYQANSGKFYLDNINNEEGNDGDAASKMLERLKNIAEVEDEKDRPEESDRDFDDEEDDFDDEDDDDYNAEKYFDDGEEFGDEGDGDDEAAF